MNYEEYQESKNTLDAEPVESVETVQEHRKFGNFKADGVVLAVVLAVVILGSILFSGSPMEKILKKTYGIDDLEVVETYEFAKEVKGLGSGYTLSLLKANGNYGMGLVNVDEGTTKDLAFQYTPLNIVVSKIFESGESINREHFKQAASYIETYGFECFTTQSTADEYLRRITGKKNGVIPTKEAQQAIIDNISLILPDITKSEEFEVIFNGNTAAPQYYAALGTQSVYNWNGMWSEESYHQYVKPTLTQSQLAGIAAVRGPAYVERTVWAVVDKNFEQVGTYTSKERMLSALR